MKTVKAKRMTRAEKLFSARIELNKVASPLRSEINQYTANRLINAIDYLFYEVELLIRELEELKPKRRGR